MKRKPAYLLAAICCFLCLLLAVTTASAFVVPKSPGDLIATAATEGQIDLEWKDNATDETGFELETSEDGVKYTKLADLKPNTVKYTHDSLPGAKKYWYRLRARNASGYSAYSNIAFATTKTVVVIPKPPTALVATALTGTQVALSWTDNSGDEAGFEVERSENGVNFLRIADVPANTVIFQDTQLAPVTKYWYRVLAKNTAGKSAFSNIATATTLQIPPAAPAALSGEPVSQTEIDLSWTDRSDNESGFQVERSLDGTVFSRIAELPANTTSYQNTGLAAATTYYYRVRAVNAAGASAYSNISSVKTLNIPVPDAPLNFTAVPSQPELIQLRWAPVTGNATEVVIERSKEVIEGYLEIARVPAAITQYEDKGKLETADYYYRIRAVNAGGSSPYSAIAVVWASSIITGNAEKPVTRQLFLSGETLVAESASPLSSELSVYSTGGKRVAGLRFRSSGSLQLSHLPPGIYIAVIQNEKEVISRKIALYLKN